MAKAGSSSASLAFWGAAAGDRVTLSLARRDALLREEALQKHICEIRDVLQTKVQARFVDLETSLTTQASEQAASLADLAQSQTMAMHEVRAQSKKEADEAQHAVADLGASLKSEAAELQSKIEECRASGRAITDKAQAEAENQLRKVQALLSERLDVQQDDLRSAEVRFKEVVRVAEGHMGEKNSALATEFRERAQRLQESADASCATLRTELHELERRQQSSALEAERQLHETESEQKKSRATLEAGVESNRSDLKSFQAETQQQLQQVEERRLALVATLQSDADRQVLALQSFKAEMQQQSSDEAVYWRETFKNNDEKMREAQTQQEKPIAALESAVVEQRSALETVKAGLEEQLRGEEGQRKSSLEEVQNQLQQFEQRQQRPIATLESSLADQRSALQALQVEMQNICGADTDSKSGMAELQQKLEAQRSMTVQVAQEVRARLHELELQQERVRTLDLDSLQKDLKSQQSQFDLATTLCRNAETATERLVAAILTGSAFLGCSHVLAVARPFGLYTVALPLLAAGAGFHVGQRSFTLEDAIRVLPQSWQLRARNCWLRTSDEIQQRGIKPLARASQEIGLDKRARSCLSALGTGASKLKKRFAADMENISPSNVAVEVAGPSPKRARTDVETMPRTLTEASSN